MPLSRAISLSNKGQIGAVLALSQDHFKTYQLQSNSVSVGRFNYSYFTRKGYEWRYDGDDSVVSLLRQGGRLGLIKGYTYNEVVQRLETEYPNQIFRIHGEQPLRTLIAMANKEVVDVIIDSFDSVNYLTKTYQEQPLVYVGSDKEHFPILTGFSQSIRATAITEFDQQLEDLIASKTLTSLLTRYHVRDWRPKSGSED